MKHKKTLIFLLVIAILGLSGIALLNHYRPRLALKQDTLELERYDYLPLADLYALVDEEASSSYPLELIINYEGKDYSINDYQTLINEKYNLVAEEALLPVASDLLVHFKTQSDFLTASKTLSIKTQDSRSPEIAFYYDNQVISSPALQINISDFNPDLLTVYAYDYAFGSYRLPIEIQNRDDLKKTLEAGQHDLSFSVSDQAGNQGNVTLQLTLITKPDLSGNLVLVNKKNPIDPSYVPDLVEFPSQYAVSSGYEATQETRDAFIKLADTLYQETGLRVLVTSSYRSYEFQGELYNSYVSQYGQSEADRFSARPGTSEHQTGLAIDLVTPSGSMWTFRDTLQYEWLKDNAHRFGFIIRYPEGKEAITGYMPEAWHIRYLDVPTATAIYQSGLTYEEYLGVN